jgi:hypothetical protein
MRPRRPTPSWKSVLFEDVPCGRCAVYPHQPILSMGTMSMRNTNPHSRAYAVLVLVSSDVLLALSMWGVAFVLQGVLGRWPLSAIAVASIVPSVVVWVWMRAALGLYPGYGLAKAEELRQQTYALLATLTRILVFAFASQLGHSISRIFLFTWALSLLVVAPVVRHYVKAHLSL